MLFITVVASVALERRREITQKRDVLLQGPISTFLRCNLDTIEGFTVADVILVVGRASGRSRKKKSNFAGFSGANSRKKRSISREFRGNFRGQFR